VDRLLLSDLAEEHYVLETLLGTRLDGWSCPTPAAGWDVLDTVRHLVVSERAAVASVLHDIDPLGGGLSSTVEAPATVEPLEVLQEWRSARRETLLAFAGCEDGARVPWGGRRMSARSLATARLMECWAHGLDCFSALGEQATDTVRLRHVAWLGWSTLPFAFRAAGEEPPADPRSLRVELDGPDGQRWEFGPAGSPDRIKGSASAWCRVVTHRWRDSRPADLEADGRLAQRSLVVARAFL
jgi:uncharacterized protein (TIGR03084 family)